MSKKNEKKEDDEKLLFRTNTMDRTVEEGNEFLQDFDPDLRSKKRKERDEERKRSQSPNKRVKRSSKSPKRSPIRSKSPKKKSPKKTAPKKTKRTLRSTSPKKTRVSTRATPVRNAISPPPKPSTPVSYSPAAKPSYTPTPLYTPPVYSSGFNFGSSIYQESTFNHFIKNGIPSVGFMPMISSSNFNRPIVPEWQFQSNSPSFALTVNNGKVWFGNDSGDVFGFTLAGEMKRRIKLPSGVKCLVADMGHWLYAGCDDGIVYDLSREEAPRIAYEIDSAVSIDNYLEIENQRNKKRNIIFVLDRSGSMANTRITAAGKNLSMVYNHHLREDDKISLIEFNDYVHVRFSSFSKNNDKQRAEMERLYFQTVPTFCNGSTALWDAIDVAYQNCDEDSSVENWIILLTDGEDNRSTKANFSTVLEKTKAKKDNTNLLVIGVGLNEAKNDLKTICQIHSKDLYIPVNASGAAEGITEAFKLVTQMLSSKIIGMEIRDGLIAVSDNVGNLSACDIEGNQNWSRKSKGTCGWVIKADFEGIYHGHTLGVSKYSPMDGNLLWETDLDSPILYGFLDRRDHILYLSSGNSIYLLSAKTGEQLGYYRTPSPLICNAYDFDNHRLFAADNLGRIYCFNSSDDRENDSKLILASVTGTAILALYYADNKLFASTSDGKLSAYDVSEPALTLLKPMINNAINTASLPVTRKVTTLETLEISKPTPNIPVMPKDRLTDEVIVECYREFDDLQIKEMANSLHDISFTSIQIGGVDYPVLLNKDGLRYVKIKGLILTQQDPEKQMNFNYKLGEKEVDKYAEMAKNGSKVTWVVNGEKDWGLIIDDEVKENGSRLLIRPAANDRGFDVTKIVQFPRSARILNAIYCVQSLTLSENGQYYRSSGEICRIDNEA